MVPEELNTGRPAYLRFLLLLPAVQMVIAFMGFVIVQIDIIFCPKKNKSLASLLCGITAFLSFFCWVAWRVTHQNENFWFRLGLVGGCLAAALIVLEWRADA